MTPRRLVLASALVALLAGCATTRTPVPVADALARDPQLSTLAGLVQKAGLSDTLRAAGPYTVFAPTNDAFKAVPQKTLDELAANPARLKAVLTYHVLPARVTAAEVKVGNAKTVEGGNLALGKAGTFVTVEDAMVQTADIAATNGVIHTIDRVLLPPVRR
ncbi:MAG: hypothetical protein RL522_1168 [Pseudomonadota bacterium]|jgi:uncharacterized surface protein with fasciclin (FAS1) repeats